MKRKVGIVTLAGRTQALAASLVPDRRRRPSGTQAKEPRS
jgi:hypothetical protein